MQMQQFQDLQTFLLYLYICGLNPFWTQQVFSPLPGVPLNPSNIRNLVENDFKATEPPPKLDRIVVAIRSDDKPHMMKGNLKRCSPEEPYYGLLLRLAKGIKTNEFTDEVVLLWLHSFLSMEGEFVHCESAEDLMWISAPLLPPFLI